VEQVQEALASIAFVATFLSIAVEVFFRYALDRPLVWSLELPSYFFLWSFSLAAGLSDWRDEQIGFDLLARRLPRRLRLAGSAAANMLIVVPLAITLPGTLSYLGLMAEQPNTGLPGTEVWGYAGVFLLFAIAVLLRGRLFFLEVRQLLHSGSLGERGM
jgi:TRAP-type C4-dicarboxylate transport system permease small subunit